MFGFEGYVQPFYLCTEKINVMIKVYETKEEKTMAFKRSVSLHKVWKDLTSGKMSFEEFKRQGYRTVNIIK